MSPDMQFRSGAVAPRRGLHAQAALLVAVGLLGVSAQAGQVQVVATGVTANTFVGDGDPCGTGQSGGNACNGLEIRIRMVIDTDAAPADQDAAADHGLYRVTPDPPAFISGGATIGGHPFFIPDEFQFGFDQTVEISDDIDGSSLGYVALDRVQLGVAGGNPQEAFAASPNLLMSSDALAGDLLGVLGNIAGSPLVLFGTLPASNGSFNFTNATGQVQGQYRVSEVAFSIAETRLLVGLPDVDDDGLADLGVLRAGANLAKLFVELRGGSSGALIGTVGFLDDNYRPVFSHALPDSDGNGVTELLVLAVRKSDARAVAEIRNVSGQALRRQITFAPNLDYLAAAVTPVDVSGNGVPELAVLGTDANGRPWVQVKDLMTGELVSKVFFDPAFRPFGFELVEGVGGNGIPELAVVGVDAGGRVRAQVKDLVTGSLASLIYFDRNYSPSHAAGLDFDGDGQSDALAVLGRNAGGVVRAQVKNVATGIKLANVRFESGYVPRGLVVVPDVDGSGDPELALLQRNGLTVRVQVKDALSGGAIKVVALSSGHSPRDLVALPDVSGNGKPELAYLGEGGVSGYLLQVKDAATGQPVSATELP